MAEAQTRSEHPSPGTAGIVFDRAPYAAYLAAVVYELTMANAHCESRARFALLHHGNSEEEDVHRALCEMMPFSDEWQESGRIEAAKHEQLEDFNLALDAVGLPEDIPVTMASIVDYCKRTRKMSSVVKEYMRKYNIFLGEEETHIIQADLR